MLTSYLPTTKELNIAHGKEKHPNSIFTSKNYEELAFPYILNYGHLGCIVEKNVILSPAKYFDQFLSNYAKLFASDSDYISFHFVSRKLKVNSQINTAMKNSFL